MMTRSLQVYQFVFATRSDMSALLALLSLLLLAEVSAAPKAGNLCPNEKGKLYLGDSVQCDKYYVCDNGELMSEELCPDGMVFDLTGKYLCDLPFDIDCGNRQELQPASRPSDSCHRLYGSFPDPDPRNCYDYHVCVEGVSTKLTCTTGTVFDPLTGTCDWAYKVRSRDCSGRPKLGNFQCPNATKYQDQYGQEVAHSWHQHETDCTLFYVCLNNFEPRLGTCPPGTAFYNLTSDCEDAAFVPGCEHLAEPEEKDEKKKETVGRARPLSRQ